MVVIPIPNAPPAISVLYRLECEHGCPRVPNPSICRRLRYAPLIHSQRGRTLIPFSKAMGIAAVYTLSLVGTNVVFNNHQQRISNSFFSCTLALNAVCTGACLCAALAEAISDLIFLSRSHCVPHLADPAADTRGQDGLLQPYESRHHRR